MRPCAVATIAGDPYEPRDGVGRTLVVEHLPARKGRSSLAPALRPALIGRAGYVRWSRWRRSASRAA